MTIVLTLPAVRARALRWVADFAFGEVLGIDVVVETADIDQVRVEAEGRTFVLASAFPPADGQTPTAEAMPRLPLAVWRGQVVRDPDIRDMPILFGTAGLSETEQRSDCSVDIFGSIFFLMSRYEELAVDVRDKHNRFPAAASVAATENFLRRPLVDELIALLWASMKRLWPSLQRRQNSGRVLISCDVDTPFDRVGTNAARLTLSLGSDLLVRRNPRRALSRAINFVAHRRGNLAYDPYYNFDWYMNACERNGHRAAFYFICGHTGGAIDGTYDVEEPRVIALMKRIHERGHEIGMHGSYETFQRPDHLTAERSALIRAMRAASIEESPAGNRQHYLRWDAACTPDHLQAAGFSYDASGGFADSVGFRFGTSREFSMWSWREHGPMRLRQRPLVVMEVSVISADYMNLGCSGEALDVMRAMKIAAMRHGGDFNLLWHNSSLLEADEQQLFLAIQDA
jgi:hypothetical protein